VLSFILSWVGKDANDSSISASAEEHIPGMRCSVAGIEGNTHVDWCETEKLKIGDELRVRLIKSDFADTPLRSESPSRGKPGWNRK